MAVRRVGTRRRPWEPPTWMVGPAAERWRGLLAGLSGVAVAVALGGVAYTTLRPPEMVPFAYTLPDVPEGGVDLVSPSPSATPAVSPSPSPAPTATTPAGFVHPGVLVSGVELDTVRAHVEAGDQPWAQAFDAMRRNAYARLDWQPTPRAVVECGYNSDPNLGCADERRDAMAAYTHALLWYLTGERDHAAVAERIIDAWAAVLTAHTNDNAPIQAAWAAAPLVRAAEILRSSDDSWDTSAADTMFRDVMLPIVANGGKAGSWANWDLTIVDAALSIAIYLDDRPLFDRMVQRWRDRLPTVIYLASDGPRPVLPAGVSTATSFWFGQATYVDGVTQETCRDLRHAALGLEALAQIAETAWVQGVDLWSEAAPRLVAALELHAAIALGDPVPAWLCGGAVTATFDPLQELAYNHYAHRVGLALPRTAALLARDRPQPGSTLFFGWETLTHAR